MCKVIVNCGCGPGGGGGGMLAAGVGVCLVAVAAPVIAASAIALVWAIVTGVCVIVAAVVVGGIVKGAAAQALDERASLPPRAVEEPELTLETLRRQALPPAAGVRMYATPPSRVREGVR